MAIILDNRQSHHLSTSRGNLKKKYHSERKALNSYYYKESFPVMITLIQKEEIIFTLGKFKNWYR